MCVFLLLSCRCCVARRCAEMMRHQHSQTLTVSRPRYPISKRKAFVSAARRIHSITRIYLNMKWSNTEKFSPFETLGPCGLDAFFFVRFLMRNVRNISFGYVVLERCVYAFYTLLPFANQHHYCLCITNTNVWLRRFPIRIVSICAGVLGALCFSNAVSIFGLGLCRAAILHIFSSILHYTCSPYVCVCGIMDLAEHTLSTRTTR